MKNIFKLMGLALIAGSLVFASCSKDEEETTTTPAFAVNFDGNEWTSDETMDYTEATFGGQFDVYKTGAKQSSVQFGCGLNTGAYGFAETDYFAKYWDDDDTEYNTPANTGLINITAIDATAKTLSGAISATFGEKALAVAMTDAQWK